MLVSLSDIKDYLGITNTDYDDFLTEQEEVICEAIQGYCGRVFPQASYTQTFYQDEFEYRPQELWMFHYPVTSLDSATEDTEDILADLRLHTPTGKVKYPKNVFFQNDETLEIQYTAGYATIPATIKSVSLSLIEERYNKKANGIAINFGSDVQSISIPGTINVQFDYSLQSNERDVAYGMILGNYVNVLDPYRSERVVVGAIKENYVA